VNTWTWAALQSFLVAQALGLWSMTVAAVTIGYTLGPTNGGFNDGPSFLVYMGHAWFGILLGAVFGIGPFYRAKQGGDAATTVVKSPNSTSIPNVLVNPESIPAVGTTVPKGT